MRAKTMGAEDTGAYLNCSDCNRPWSVNFGRPMCSTHAWDKSDGVVSASHTFAYRQNHTGPKAWAHRIIERSKHESGVTETVLAMARRALGEIE